jgi:hypothetical protein
MLSNDSIEARRILLKVPRAVLVHALHAELSALRPLPDVVTEIAHLVAQGDRARVLYMLAQRDLVACARPGIRRAARALAVEIAIGWEARRVARCGALAYARSSM